MMIKSQRLSKTNTLIALSIIGLMLVSLITACSTSSTHIQSNVTTTESLLPPCPNKPNCVCSVFPDDKARYIAPLPVSETPITTLKKLNKAIIATGGEIISSNEQGINAIYRSSLYLYLGFGFIDDVNLRIDAEAGLVQLRSASRTGYYDFGVNRERIEAIKAAYLP